MAQGSELYLLLGRVALFLLCTYVAGRLCRMARVPPLIGWILVGIALGPEGADLLPFTDEAAEEKELTLWEVAGQAGVGLILFQSGTHVSLQALQLLGPRALVAALVATVLPTVLGMALLRALGFELYPTAFSGGLALAPTSVDVVFEILGHQRQLHRAYAQFVLVSSFLTEALSLTGLVILVRQDDQPAAVDNILLPLVYVVIFIGCSFVVARFAMPPLVAAVLRFVRRRGWNFNAHLLLMLLGLALCGFVGAELGSWLLGAFLAGMLFSQVPRSVYVWRKATGEIAEWLIILFFAASTAFVVPLSEVLTWRAFWRGLVLAVGPLYLGKLVAAVVLPSHALVVGTGLACRGEFNFLIAERTLFREASTSHTHEPKTLLSEDAFAVIVWALVMGILVAPAAFQAALNRHLKRMGVTPSPYIVRGDTAFNTGPGPASGDNVVKSKSTKNTAPDEAHEEPKPLQADATQQQQQQQQQPNGQAESHLPPSTAAGKGGGKEGRREGGGGNARGGGDADADGDESDDDDDDGRPKLHWPRLHWAGRRGSHNTSKETAAAQHKKPKKEKMVFRIVLQAAHHSFVMFELLETLRHTGLDVVEATITDDGSTDFSMFVVRSTNSRPVTDRKLADIRRVLRDTLDDPNAAVLFYPMSEDSRGTLAVTITSEHDERVMQAVFDHLEGPLDLRIASAMLEEHFEAQVLDVELVLCQPKQGTEFAPDIVAQVKSDLQALLRERNVRGGVFAKLVSESEVAVLKQALQGNLRSQQVKLSSLLKIIISGARAREHAQQATAAGAEADDERTPADATHPETTFLLSITAVLHKLGMMAGSLDIERQRMVLYTGFMPGHHRAGDDVWSHRGAVREAVLAKAREFDPQAEVFVEHIPDGTSSAHVAVHRRLAESAKKRRRKQGAGEEEEEEVALPLPGPVLESAAAEGGGRSAAAGVGDIDLDELEAGAGPATRWAKARQVLRRFERARTLFSTGSFDGRQILGISPAFGDDNEVAESAGAHGADSTSDESRARPRPSFEDVAVAAMRRAHAAEKNEQEADSSLAATESRNAHSITTAV